MKKTFLIAFLLLSLSSTFLAQRADDALRFSIYQPSGTARFVATGGSLGALGADLSVMSTNPAGIASFRKSEFALSPSFSFINSEGNLERANNSVSENKFNFNMDNVGIVFVNLPNNPRWRTANFGIGFNRQVSFYEKFVYEGLTNDGSITEPWLEGIRANPNNVLPFGEQQAIDTEAIYFDEQLGEYFSDFVGFNEVEIFRRNEEIVSGGVNELTFTGAGNLNDKLYLGATLGVPFARYKVERTYEEEDQLDGIPFFRRLVYTENIDLEGTGVNFKLGMIYRASQALRLGFAVHTPSGFTITDDLSTSLTYSFEDNGSINNSQASSPEFDPVEYKIRTPWRLIGDAGFIFGRSGFLSAEVEWADYSGMKFIATDVSTSLPESELDLPNEDINALYGSALNIRLGGEYAYNFFRARAGFTIQTSPFSSGGDDRNTISAGFGYRGERVYLDLAYVYTDISETVAPYLLLDGTATQLADKNQNRQRIILTAGFKFN